MYDREGARNRFQYKSFQRKCDYLHENPEVVEKERMIPSRAWLRPISSLILHSPTTEPIVSREIPSITEICSSYETPYSTMPSSREENRFKRSYNSRPDSVLRISEGLLSSSNSLASQRDILHSVQLEPESQKATSTLNHPYSREQLHCVRYLKEDLHLPWNRVFEEFHRIFSEQPGFIVRESEAALTSRSYRDNFIYASINNRPLLNSNGMPIRVQAKVRQRLVAEERHIPFKLVEKHPSWAVRYDWVRSEHRAQAQAILDSVDPIYYNSKKDQHRRVIEKAEQIEENMMGKTMDADLFADTRDPIISIPPRIF